MTPKIVLSAQFIHHFKTRISQHKHLVEAYRSSFEAFKIDPFFVIDHALTGDMEGMRSFWIDNDYRVVYSVYENSIVFWDIGTHEQIYQ